MKHTPGPWKFMIGDGYSETDWVIRQATVPERFGQVVIRDPNCKAWAKDPEFIANFHLIAAAPDLLEACKLALKVLEDNGMGDCTCESGDWTVGIDPSGPCEVCQLRAAIAKAE